VQPLGQQPQRRDRSDEALHRTTESFAVAGAAATPAVAGEQAASDLSACGQKGYIGMNRFSRRLLLLALLLTPTACIGESTPSPVAMATQTDSQTTAAVILTSEAPTATIMPTLSPSPQVAGTDTATLL
jgi:hypothetical protein